MDDIQRNKEEALTQTIAQRLGVRYMDVRNVNIPVDESILTYQELQQYHLAPIKRNNFEVVLAFTEQTDRNHLRMIKNRFPDQNVNFRYISESAYKQIVQQFKDVYDPDVDPLTNLQQGLNDVENNKMLEFLLTKAEHMHASDIHLETKSNHDGQIRFRIDGVLHVIDTVIDHKFKHLISQIVIQGSVDAASQNGKSGHLKFTVNDEKNQPHELNARVEVLDTNYGQDVVIRLFTIDERYLSLDRIGLMPYHQEVIQKTIQQTEGMLLLVGPTGSGKTTSLYAIINQFDKASKKIITLEDPVEFELSGVSQIPVDTSRGQSFAAQLRNTLREDPDVIMLGEVRDVDAAATSLQAALTGHLVLSTFHANSAAASLVRIVDMVGRGGMVASALKLIMAQRLVRRLCDACKQPQTLNEELTQYLQSVLDTLPEAARRYIDNEPTKIYQPQGCDECQGIGYKGRIAIIEQLRMSDNIEKLILTQATPTDIEKYAVENESMIVLAQDAFIKVLKGYTSLDEIKPFVEM